MIRRAALLVTGFVLAAAALPAGAQETIIRTVAFKAEMDRFFDAEIPSHFSQVRDSGPLPERVHGALTTGEFSWAAFARSLAAYADARGTLKVSGRDIVPLITRIGVSESKSGGKTFAQLNSAMALRYLGRDLATNALWRSLSDEDRGHWKSLLDPTRFYDPKTRQVINLPENYLGVAARVASIGFQMGVLDDRAFLDSILDRAAEPFTRGALYADDGGTTGRYDRYSNEYARYVYEAAESAGRKDLVSALTPTLNAQMKLWWDLVSLDGYGYPWGRSLGVVSYLDTLEITGFLALHPEFRPAPLKDLVSEFRRSWMWLMHDYKPATHLLSVFDPGRGNYAYISKEREWQQTSAFFGKALIAQENLFKGIAAEKLQSFPAVPTLKDVARFEFFRQGDRPAGVWLVRQGALRFALPITTGTKPGVADYLPAPHGLPGFATPVEQVFPAGSSFFEMSDGRVLIAGDSADEIVPAKDGRSVRATWRRFVAKGGKVGEWIEPGFQVSVAWRIEGSTLTRVETMTATRDTPLTRVSWILPSTATTHAVPEGSVPTVRLTGPEGVLEVTTSGNLGFTRSIRTHSGDEALGRSARGAIPTHVAYEADNLRLEPGRPRTWEISLSVSAAPQKD